MTTTTPDPQIIAINTPIKMTNNGTCVVSRITVYLQVLIECKPILAENWETHKRNNPNATFYSVPNFVPEKFVPMFIRQKLSLQVEMVSYPDPWEDAL